jgi:hypothetical protein
MGKPFTEAEVRRAAAYLVAKDLIKGPGAWGSAGSPVRASITPQGQDCVEEYGGDVSEYLRDQARGGIVNEIGTFNQHGGAVAFGNTGPITQNGHPARVQGVIATPACSLRSGLGEVRW